MSKGIRLDDEVFLHRVAYMFVGEGKSVVEIRRDLAELYPGLTSQYIYRALAMLGRRKIISYNSLRETGLEEKLHKEFGIPRDKVHVVKFPHDVPSEAARLAKDILAHGGRDRWRRSKKPVGLGLGPGLTTAEMAFELGRLLEASLPLRLKLFSLAGGAPADEPQVSPISFFSSIPEPFVESRVGLFAPNLILKSQYEVVKRTPGVKEAMRMREEIFLCVTSMGDASDDRDLLRRFLEAQSDSALRGITSKGYVGDIQYRPYSSTGPIEEDEDDFRAVTLFEIDDLVRRARTGGTHTILMARNKTRDAMLPVLRERRLRIFTELIVDSATAVDVCGEGE